MQCSILCIKLTILNATFFVQVNGFKTVMYSLRLTTGALSAPDSFHFDVDMFLHQLAILTSVNFPYSILNGLSVVLVLWL